MQGNDYSPTSPIYVYYFFLLRLNPILIAGINNAFVDACWFTARISKGETAEHFGLSRTVFASYPMQKMLTMLIIVLLTTILVGSSSKATANSSESEGEWKKSKNNEYESCLSNMANSYKTTHHIP